MLGRDTIFALGALILALFVIGLGVFRRREGERCAHAGKKSKGARGVAELQTLT